MSTAQVQPVHGKPAAEVGDSLVVSDLHFGLEAELRRKGVEVRSRGEEKLERLHDLLDATGAEHLVLNGDLKHNVPVAARSEVEELKLALTELSSRVDVTVVPGNHDGGIHDIAPARVEIAGSGGIRIGDVGILHGHALPDEEVEEADVLLLGHTHPKVVLQEGNGAVTQHHAWLRIPGDPAKLVMPAFDDWGGSDVARDGLLGPLDLDGDPEVVLLDGAKLGRLSEVKGAGEKESESLEGVAE